MSGLQPPLDFASRKLPIISVSSGSILHRSYNLLHDPLFFDGSRSGRFNSPDAAYGVMYAAAQRKGAFAETFLRTPGKAVLDESVISGRGFAQLRALGQLKLASMMSQGLAQMGATAEVTHSPLPYDIPQSWSKALAEHSANIDGIAYRSRHDDSAVCYAVFDRASHLVEVFSTDRDLTSCDWFWRLMNRYKIGLAP